MADTPKIVAHRGHTEDFPENTLPAFQAALEHGADAIELDVQFCRDGTPVAFHDEHLDRLTGTEGALAHQEFEELRKLCVHEPGRFGERFAKHDIAIPSLTEAARYLAEHDAPLVFIDVKRDTLAWHDTPAGTQAVLKACEPLKERFVIISADENLLRQARSMSKVPIGLVLSSWDANEWERADALTPEYLFVDEQQMPPPGSPLWEGPWQWAVYEVNEPDRAYALGKRGVAYVETRDVRTMKKGKN